MISIPNSPVRGLPCLSMVTRDDVRSKGIITLLDHCSRRRAFSRRTRNGSLQKFCVFCGCGDTRLMTKSAPPYYLHTDATAPNDGKTELLSFCLVPTRILRPRFAGSSLTRNKRGDHHFSFGSINRDPHLKGGL